MFLALHEIRRGLVRFGLLAMAIGLLLFLVLFQQALQDGLLTSFVGALRNQSAPVLVYAIDSQRTLQGSVLTPDLESAILAVDGVGEHGRLGRERSRPSSTTRRRRTPRSSGPTTSSASRRNWPRAAARLPPVRPSGAVPTSRSATPSPSLPEASR